MTIPTPAMSKTKMRALTKSALQRLYSPSTARRLWELHEMGVSVGTLARARKALDGFSVTPENDGEWSFLTYGGATTILDCIKGRIPLSMYHEKTRTYLEVLAE